MPGRNLLAPATEQEQSSEAANENDEEIENSETESHRRLRYVCSSIEEVSDPEYWQELCRLDCENSSDDETAVGH